MILRSKHLNACFRSVQEEVSFLVFLTLCGGNLVLERRPHLVLIRLVVFVLLLVAEFGPLVSSATL